MHVKYLNLRHSGLMGQLFFSYHTLKRNRLVAYTLREKNMWPTVMRQI